MPYITVPICMAPTTLENAASTASSIILVLVVLLHNHWHISPQAPIAAAPERGEVGSASGIYLPRASYGTYVHVDRDGRGSEIFHT